MIKNKLKYILIGTGIIICALGFYLYSLVFGISIFPEGKKAVLLIPDGAVYVQLMDSVRAHLTIRNQKVFDWVSAVKNFHSGVKPGRYVIDRGMSCNAFINMLKGGRQSPVTITFNNIRTIYDLSGRVGGQIEADSLQILTFLSDKAGYENDGFTRENVISVFIPDSYEIYWNTNARGFYKRMLREYKNFWTPERRKKAEAVNLTPVEVSTLASIVEEEALKDDEKPRIAGVYLNRLRRGIPLQADPTVKFAVNDFTITRILKKHLLIDSPYNTYKYSGLPPGPIACPGIESIEAVLNAEKHDYLFFAARADFSGYHNFSRTLTEHNRNAARYQKELNRRRIFR
jgi:UPF0755 protein